MEEWWDNLREECRLMQLDSLEAKIRFSSEIAISIGAFLYLAAAIREARFLGTRMFFENLVGFVFCCCKLTITSILENFTFSCNVFVLLYTYANNTIAKTCM